MNASPSSANERADCCGLSRRGFLQGLAGAAAAAAAMPLLSSRVAYASSSTWEGPILVVLSLRGGMDGLSVVAPVGDPDYARRRPSIAVPTSLGIPTGDRRFALHPALAPLAPLWHAGTMAAVHAVGTPDGSRSHFQATAELERAAPGTSIRTGWLDRVLGVAGTGTSFQAAQLGSSVAAGLLAGPERDFAARSLSDVHLAGSEPVRSRMLTALQALHTDPRDVAVPPAQLAFSTMATAGALVAHPRPAGAYPARSALGAALSDAAVLIRAGLGLQAVAIDVGDWDMHVGLGDARSGWMHDKLTDLAASVAAFRQDLGPLWDRVTVLTISEFGRRATENASGGVDHGHGNVVLLFGGGLRGGAVHGRWPGLTDDALDHGDLAGTTDYRDVLAEYLTRRMRLPASRLRAVFPGLTASPPGVFA